MSASGYSLKRDKLLIDRADLEEDFRKYPETSYEFLTMNILVNTIDEILIAKFNNDKIKEIEFSNFYLANRDSILTVDNLLDQRKIFNRILEKYTDERIRDASEILLCIDRILDYKNQEYNTSERYLTERLCTIYINFYRKHKTKL